MTENYLTNSSFEENTQDLFKINNSKENKHEIIKIDNYHLDLIDSMDKNQTNLSKNKQ